LSALTGGVRVASCKRTARSPARRQNGPRSGTHSGTSAATARSAKAESPKAGIVRGLLNIIRSGEVEHWCGIPLILLGLERATLNIIEIRFSLLDQWMM
jgi:hypothetical protein